MVATAGALTPLPQDGSAPAEPPASARDPNVPVQQTKWFRLRQNGTAMARYLLDSEVHTYAFSVAANAILSFIPLAVLMYTLALSVFHSQAMAGVVNDMVNYFLPSVTKQPNWLASNLEFAATLSSRHGVQALSLLMILISCTGIFLPLEVALNQAWGVRKSRNYLFNQAIAFGLAIWMVVLGMTAMLLSAGQRQILAFLFFHHTDNGFCDGRSAINYVWLALCTGVASILFFFSIYWILPNCKVPAKSVMRSSIATGVVWLWREDPVCGPAAAPGPEVALRAVFRVGGAAVLGLYFGADFVCGGTGERGQDRGSKIAEVGDYFTLNDFTAMAFGPRPAGSMVKSERVEVRTTATSPERESTTNSRWPAAENAMAEGSVADMDAEPEPLAVVDGIDSDPLRVKVGHVEQRVVGGDDAGDGRRRPSGRRRPLRRWWYTTSLTVSESELETKISPPSGLRASWTGARPTSMKPSRRSGPPGLNLESASAIAMTWWPAEQATKALDESGRMTASPAPGQSCEDGADAARLGARCDGDGVAAAVGDHQALAIRRKQRLRRLLAHADLRDFAPGGEIDDGDGVGAGVGDVSELAVGVHTDRDRLAVQRNDRGDRVLLRVHAPQRALTAGSAGVDDVDLVARGAGGNGHGIRVRPGSRDRGAC